MTAIELLRECKNALLRGQRDEQMAMFSEIDTYLSTPPSERAMEVARKVREGVIGTIFEERVIMFELHLPDAAREIEAFEQGWISVKERLPEKTEWVVALCKDGSSCVAVYFKEPGWTNEDGLVKNVTHWMPLPPAPEAQGEKNGKDI